MCGPGMGWSPNMAFLTRYGERREFLELMLPPALASHKWSCLTLPILASQVVSTGGGGHVDLLRRAGPLLTYRSLCPPDDLADRGLLGVKSSYYAQDALRLWEILYR